MKRLAPLVALPLVLAALALVALLAPRPSLQAVDVAAANDVVASLAADWPVIQVDHPGDWTVVVDGAVRAHQGAPITGDLEAARRDAHGYDVTVDDEVVARVYLASDLSARSAAWAGTERTATAAVLLVAAIAATVWAAWFYARYLRPFRTLESFAASVAAGRLEVPLRMDRAQAFGAFSESFDLMRTELAAARAAQHAAETSKRDLLAQIGHDLRTPASTISAQAELLALHETDAARAQRLQAIIGRATQIGTLLDELSRVSNDDLDALPVRVRPEPSRIITELLHEVDVTGAVGDPQITDALLLVDPVRLAQVLDNIVANAAKYAGTPLEISSGTSADTFHLDIRDHGPGVPADEIDA
ncbi:MAG: HAMP domain-containing sensor histidine kinase, partial [Brachybacterium sp.]|nr:HAMP domain-containing sensor histidine kinase [Brachybacterium sp.]